MRFSRFLSKRKAVQILVVLFVAQLAGSRIGSAANYLTEYSTYVHTYVNSGSLGNWTYLEKPCFPVLINDSQIMPGQNWTIVCPLVANHTYHAYLYGNFTNSGPYPLTCYDVYVYDDAGEMVGYHTPSAGLLANLGTNGSAFFVPQLSGNYTFVISNNIKASQAAQEATFMLIEDVQTDVWNQHYAEGFGSANLPMLNTSWGYEFATASQYVEVYVNVPKTLDMYEARLYLMSDSSSTNQTILDGVPLAWEQGLYGITSNGTTLTNTGTTVTGGYNLDTEGYRGNAYSSCEYYGQGMFLNFSAPKSGGLNLYHLVFIGEVGYGTIDYLIKTEFNNTYLKPVTVPTAVYPDNDTTISYASNSTDLQNAILQYTTDNWNSNDTIDMDVSNNTCNATIPKQAAGTTVNYIVTATDTLENLLGARGAYQVKYASTMNLTSTSMEPTLGDNVTLEGSFNPQTANVPITIYVSSANVTEQIQCFTLQDGTFMASFRPNSTGEWLAYAEFYGNSSIFASESPPLTIQVQEPVLTKYSLFILIGVGTATAIGVLVYARKFKG
ncbi:MAG: hypothetical protein ABSB89_05745 [Candidatus Bathyarchaeia archaeon]